MFQTYAQNNRQLVKEGAIVLSAKREALASQIPSSLNTIPSTQLAASQSSPPFD